MNTVLECFPCMVKHCSSLLKDLDVSDETRERLMREVLSVMSEADCRLSPPGIARLFYRRLAELLGEDMDPYREKKDRSTALAVALLKRLRDDPEVDLSSFENRVRLAISGNVLDLGIYTDLTWEDARRSVLEALRSPLDLSAVQVLRERMSSARRILYLLDNCGEAVFDRLLLEACGSGVTVGVRGAAVINDVTRREVAASGLGCYPVVDSGQRMPGLDPATCSREMREALESSDLIIAKGQGNFESLNDSSYPIAFLFMSKCPLVCDMLGAQPRSLQVRFTSMF